MPRFCFHVSSKDEFMPDTTGAELDDLGAAHGYALRLILKVMETFSDAPDWRGWRVEITDEDWRTVLVVLFPDRVPERADRAAFPKKKGPPWIGLASPDFVCAGALQLVQLGAMLTG